MSQAEKFMELVKNGVQRMGAEIGAELRNQAGRGASELANALFGGQGFVLYGHGNSHPANVDQLGKEQQGPSPEVQQPHIEGHEQSKGRGL